jgi:hypothetical protein
VASRKPGLAFGFDLPFAEQIEFFRQKINLPTAAWDDITKSAHDRSWVVAGATKADLLDDLRQAVDKAISTGTTLRTFRKDFRAIVAKHGWTGWTGEGTPEGFAWRTRVIYETNLRTSYAAGRWAQLNDPRLARILPYWRYVHVDGTLNPRPLHQRWGNMRLTLPRDHPFWQTHFPPNGWGCRCRVTAVTGPKDGDATAPPEGWDAIDPRTGEQVGIGKGWGYAPGASMGDEIARLVKEKAAKLPERLASDFLSSVAARPAAATAMTPALREQIRRNMEGPAGDGLSAGVARNAALHVVREGIRDGAEHLVAFDAVTGRVIERTTSGAYGEVVIPPKTRALLDDKNARTILHHNHPDSYSLSGKDLDKLAYPGGWKVVAHGHDGSVYSAERIVGMARHIQRAHSAANAAVIENSRLFRVETEGIRAHLVNRALAEAGVIKYDFTLSPSLQAMVDSAPATYDRLVADAVAAIRREIAK